MKVRGLNEPFKWVVEGDQKIGFRFDRALEIYGKYFFFEIERGTQGIDIIRDKINVYKKLEVKEKKFHVIFICDDYYMDGRLRKSGKDNCTEIIKLTHEARRGNQFNVCYLPDLNLSENCFINYWESNSLTSI